MIAVSPMAGLARAISRLGPIPFLEKARWLDVDPEYNPLKYNFVPGQRRHSNSQDHWRLERSTSRAPALPAA